MPANDGFAMTPAVIPRAPAPLILRKEMTIQDLWEILARRRKIIVSVFGLTVLTIAVAFAFATRLYKGSAELQVQKEAADALSIDTMMGPESASDAVDLNVTLQTQAQILQSDSLALRVIKELNLENSEDFRPHFNPVGWLVGLISPAGIADPVSAPLEGAPVRRARILKIFESRLKVKAVANTRLIDVDYFSKDPRTAAAVANQLVEDLIDYNFQTRHNATREATVWLGNQLNDLREQSDGLQARVLKLQRASGVFAFGQTDRQGNQQVFAPALDRLQQATTQLEQARDARIMKGALYKTVKHGDAELISELAGNGALGGASPGVQGSLTLLQNLRTEEAQAQADLNELSAKFGPGYPKLTELQSRLESTQQSIHSEVARLAGRVGNDYAVAQQIEHDDHAVFRTEKLKAQATDKKAIEYEIAQQEATRSRNLYESLVNRMREADVVAGLRSSNITLVDPARVPPKPAKPSVLIYGAASLAGGLLFGICGALYRDATDNRIQEVDEMELLFAQEPIGVLPYHNGRSDRASMTNVKALVFGSPIPLGSKARALAASNATVAATQPRAPYTEAVRVLCTSLMQGKEGGSYGQVILVTSSVFGEGKSMLSANLAIVYAQRGKRVLLVDGDLRRPVLHQYLNLRADYGLASLLEAQDLDEAAFTVQVPLPQLPNLHALPAGPLPAYPAELLASGALPKLLRICRNNYDYIIIGSAPILPVTDSALLSRHADFTLVVARHAVTDRRSLERTCQILRSQGVRQIGLALNGIKVSGGARYGHYGYKDISQSGSELHAEV